MEIKVEIETASDGSELANVILDLDGKRMKFACIDKEHAEELLNCMEACSYVEPI